MIHKHGEEFIEIQRGHFIRAKLGHGTHIWDGKKKMIVPKTEIKKGEKT